MDDTSRAKAPGLLGCWSARTCGDTIIDVPLASRHSSSRLRRCTRPPGKYYIDHALIIASGVDRRSGVINFAPCYHFISSLI